MSNLKIEEINYTPSTLNIESTSGQPQTTTLSGTSSGSSIRAGQRRLRTQTVLLHAANAPSDELVKVLIKYANDKHINSTLHNAIEANDLSAVEILLRNGYNPNELMDGMIHPLSPAIRMKNKPIMDLLLNYGAQPSELYVKELNGGYRASYSSVLFDLIFEYCTRDKTDGISFIKETINDLARRELISSETILDWKGVKYNAVQACLNMNVIIKHFGITMDFSASKKQRAAELAAFFLNSSIYCADDGLDDQNKTKG